MNAVGKKTILNDTPYAIVMLSPNIILFFTFMLFPIIWTFVMSLSKYDLITPMQFIGIDNFINIFRDEVALQCLRNTVVFTFITVPVGLVLSLFLAVLLDSGIMFKKIYRAAFFLPSITSWVAIAVVWQWLYNPEFGLINYFLSFFGAPPIQWLTTSRLSLLSVCIVCIWKNAGYGMLLFLAGLQSISAVYYEASELDGANPLQQLIHITIPLLTPTTFFVFVTSIIGSFQTFDIINLMTKGGPGRSSSLLAHYLYQTAFKYMKMGYASALAYLLFFVIMVITIINMRFEKKSHEIY
ncbi:MAG: sugar ABC transporter permease [Treponema sp.]|jgi:multiple sugar transport system permease protein|nr:sugar ABC transporter permease [Treponema sp.]